MRFRPVARGFFFIFIFFCFILGWCGAGNPDDVAVPIGAGLTFKVMSQIATAYYFAFFLIILPVLGMTEKAKERPESITKSVLGDSAAAPAE
jgi:ubiquinol-cytochrome c reductase cytochrome b subunit